MREVLVELKKEVSHPLQPTQHDSQEKIGNISIGTSQSKFEQSKNTYTGYISIRLTNTDLMSCGQMAE